MLRYVINVYDLHISYYKIIIILFSIIYHLVKLNWIFGFYILFRDVVVYLGENFGRSVGHPGYCVVIVSNSKNWWKSVLKSKLSLLNIIHTLNNHPVYRWTCCNHSVILKPIRWHFIFKNVKNVYTGKSPIDYYYFVSHTCVLKYYY
jgi:hypothetical protein